MESSIREMLVYWKNGEELNGVVAVYKYLLVARLSGHMREDEKLTSDDYLFWKAVSTSYEWTKAMDLLRKSNFLPSFVRDYMKNNPGKFEERLYEEQEEALWDYCQLNFDRIRCMQKYNHATDEGKIADLKAEYKAIVEKMGLRGNDVKSKDFDFTIPALPEKQ